MANTIVNQIREAVIVSGTAQYRIIASCTDAGDLQDTGIFLLGIVNVDDPKDDIFTRIIEISDIQAFSTDRDTAIDNADGYWRSATATFIYNDIETANAAWKELSSRINLLVETYDAFTAEFATPTSGVRTTYPAVDESAKTALKSAYYAANDALVAAQEALTDHDCGTLESDIADTEERLAEAQSDLALYTTVQAGLLAATPTYTTIHTSLNVNNSTVRSLNSTSSAVEVEKDGIEAILVGNDALLTQFSTQNGALAAINASATTATNILRARVTTLTQAKNKLFTDLNKCRTEEAKLQAAVTSAQITREAALAAVVAACPDFVP